MPAVPLFCVAGNPLGSLMVSAGGAELKIKRLDLSGVKLHSLDPRLLTALPHLHSLNLSRAGLQHLQWTPSQVSGAALRELDLRAGVTEELPRGVLRGFPHLQLVFADTFHWCCPSQLPPSFDLNHCHVTRDDVSSCDDLLGSVTYRATVASLATLALLGNVVSLTVRVCVGRSWRLSSGGVVLTHLSVADLGTGLYLAILGLADRLLTGQYVWQDVAWRRGAVCQLAGVLALSCRHAATFFTAVLTLHRCLQRYPALTPRLTLVKVKVVCVMVWASSLLLTTVPLMAGWRVYGQQALCLPLPHNPPTPTPSTESQYTYGVMVLLQLIVLALSCVCAAACAACSRVSRLKLVSNTHCPKDDQFLLLGSLSCGLLYTLACVVPTDRNSEGQAAAHTALVFFGAVASGAVDPYLHLYGVRAERRERIKEERLMKIIGRARL